MGLWSFLRGLWPWRARPRPTPPSRPEPPPETPQEAAPESAPAPELRPTDEAAVVATSEAAYDIPLEPVEPAAVEPEEPEDEAEQDEDGGWEDEDLDDPDAPDPFISGAEPEPDDADLEERRAAARAAALAGEQRIYISMPAGPGSLAEALEQLATEGLVTAEFIGDGEDEPHILYRPVA